MPNYLAPLNCLASGPINPMVFVSVDPYQANHVFQASGSSFLAGISQVGTLMPPGLQSALFPGTTPVSQVAAYNNGDQCEVFFGGDVAPIVVGSGAVNPGDLLTNDPNGCARTATTGQWYGALALEGGSNGQIIRALTVTGKA